jgi:hypothetical protein
MVKEYFFGWMVDLMKVSTIMIKNKGLEFLDGLMEECMKGLGMMVNSMERQK